MACVIPLFPLNLVLVPGMAMPLHLFEPRYRQLLLDVQRGSGPGSFGIIALRSGTDSQRSAASVLTPQIVDVGTLAEILDVTHYDDGTADVLTVGSRRFRVLELLDGVTPYLQAEIDWVDELDGNVHPAHVAVTRRLCTEYFGLVGLLTGRSPVQELPHDANQLSYHVAAHLPLGLPERQDLLARADAAGRLQEAICLLRREIGLVQGTRTVSVPASALNLVPHAN